MGSLYQQLHQRMTDIALLQSSASVLGWDQETFMPPAGVGYRGKQLAQLAGMVHEMVIAPANGDALASLQDQPAIRDQPHSVQAVNVRQWQRAYDQATKLPTDLVKALAETTSQAKADWQQARKDSRFETFAPSLKALVGLLQTKADALAANQPQRANGERWDALADLYEPGMTAQAIAEVFAPLKVQLSELVAELMASDQGPSDAFIKQKLPIPGQKQLVDRVLEAIGFDFNKGRLDLAAHPFCSGIHPNDVRLTTRYAEDNLPDALSSSMHEAGHGMYEQGLLAEHTGTPMASAASLAIHESQSRMWENQVGRSRAFWQWAEPILRETFGDAVAGYALEDIYKGCNRVEPSLIRVEADEATYNLHIMIRFDLERAMMKNDLAIDDLPGAWNDAYKAFLNLDVPNDSVGCLQDIHWSMGAIGYFPTYTLGNLYAAQMYAKALEDLPGLEDGFAEGNFAPLLGWLREKVHRHGQTFTGPELIENITGKPLSSQPLLDSLAGKLKPVYGLS